MNVEERNKIINELKALAPRVFLIAMPNEYALEYNYFSSSGVGMFWANIEQYPLYTINPIEHNKWLEIKRKIKENTLERTDLEGTDLDYFLPEVEPFYATESEMLNNLKSLLDIPNDNNEAFYVAVDIEYNSYFKFTATVDEALKEVDKIFSHGTSWENVSDSQIEEIYNNINNYCEIEPLTHE